MHKFKVGDVVMVGEKETVQWDGKWPSGEIGIVALTTPYFVRCPLYVDTGNGLTHGYFAPEELYYIGRL